MLSFSQFKKQMETLLAGAAELEVQAQRLERAIDHLDERAATEAKQQELRQRIQQN
jgi:hypothetical protein